MAFVARHPVGRHADRRLGQARAGRRRHPGGQRRRSPATTGTRWSARSSPMLEVREWIAFVSDEPTAIRSAARSGWRGRNCRAASTTAAGGGRACRRLRRDARRQARRRRPGATRWSSPTGRWPRRWPPNGRRRASASTRPPCRSPASPIRRSTGSPARWRRSAPKSSNMPAATWSAIAARGPESLVAAQEAAWGPVLAWAREALGARFVLAEGIIAVEQPAESLAAVDSGARRSRPAAACRRPRRHHAHRLGADRACRPQRRARRRRRPGRPPMSTRTGRWSSGAGTRWRSPAAPPAGGRCRRRR